MSNDLKRCAFLAGGVAAGLVASARGSAHALTTDARVLILIELNGGNDGLNTVVPYGDRAYGKLRPRLALGRDTLLPLDERTGLNGALSGLMKPWQAGELAVIDGVGYARPNRSHFRSIEIWDTASDADEVLAEGWVSRVLREGGARGKEGVVLGGSMGPLAGDGLATIVLGEPDQFLRNAQGMVTAAPATPNPALAHMLKVRSQVGRSAERLLRPLKAGPALVGSFPKTPIGGQLELAGQLVAANTPVFVIKAFHTGFDTHAGQAQRHRRLLQQLGEALGAFRQAMIAAGAWDRVLVMTYAEFGRRATENASGGTDHGTAAAHFVLGGAVRGGLYGDPPRLDDLENGDLKHQVDFRQLYASVAQHWWGLGRAESLAGHRPLGFLV